MGADSRSCREFIRQMNDPRSMVNCGSCRAWMHREQRCRYEDSVLKAHEPIKEEDREFDRYEAWMRNNRGVYLE